MSCLKSLFTALLLVSPAWPQAGAKAMFYNPVSGVPVPSVPLPVSPRMARPPAPALPAVIAPVNAARSIGLRYWIELLSTTGEMKRVTNDYAFRNGDRIRLHLESNIAGQLTIVQSQDGGAFQRLFPGRQSTGKVEAFSDQVIPSAKGSFRFDDHPGKLELLLKLETGEPPVLMAAVTDEETQRMAMHMRAEIEQAKRATGGKALVLEEDPETSTGAIYACTSPGKPGPLTLAIRLAHR